MNSYQYTTSSSSGFQIEARNCCLAKYQQIDFQQLFKANNPYPFTGKELDSETGYSYFGARYYDAELSGLFFSVDPMSDKYPSIGPYAYCAWNPSSLIDHKGDSITLSKEAWDVQKEAFLSVFNRKDNIIPFSYNEETKKMYYIGDITSSNYSEAQKEIIEHYKTLCENNYNITVHIVNNDEVIKTTQGSITLGGKFATGLTVDHGNNTADVYISKRPLYNYNGERRVHPQKEAHQSISILHEIGGHAYYFSQNIRGAENNRLTSEFENMCRAIFIGNYRMATKEIRQGESSENH